MTCMLCGWPSGHDVCQPCLEAHTCGTCDGQGIVAILKDNAGRIDYISGESTGETADCQTCEGTGFRL